MPDTIKRNPIPPSDGSRLGCAAHLVTLISVGILIALAQSWSPAQASVSKTSGLCDRAARAAADASEVPYDVMLAISRVETGRSSGDGLKPWPWTVNMEGAGRWFSNEDEARSYVFKHFKNGARSFDVGCFQINYKWHGSAFRSIDDMFDPDLNAAYAASFLRDLYDELGDWALAAGAYHSRTPTYANAYAAKFETVRDSLGRDVPLLDDREFEPDTDQSPGLFANRSAIPLIGNGTSQLGSLVPLQGQASGRNLAFVAVN